MPIRKSVVEAKVAKIREMVKRLEDMDFDEAGFMADVDIQDLVVFRLTQCVELVIDIATHLVAAVGEMRPETNADLFGLLVKRGFLTVSVGEAMVRATGFRNLAVHEYLSEEEGREFDVKQVYGDLRTDIADLLKFCAEVLTVLKNN